MRRTVLTLSALCLSLTFFAQSSLDLQSRIALERLRGNRITLATDTLPAAQKKAARQQVPQTVPAMLKVAEGTTIEQLEQEGLQVQAMRGNIAMVTMPLDEVENIAANSQYIKQLQLPREVATKNDKARASVGVDQIHLGTGLPQAYTGKGVVAGIVDQGLDPNHINFRDENGNSRVGYLSYITYNSTTGGFDASEYDASTMYRFSTDDATTFHGTHTMGTMAGSFRGEMQVADYVNGSEGKVSTQNCPYYGIAYEADIVASCGSLLDYYIALGMEGVFNYADFYHMPVVFNLSLGSTTGPHDGNTILSQYLALAGKEAIVCVAAGNEGDLPIALNDTLREDNGATLQTFIKPIYESYETSTTTFTNLRSGQVYIYSNDTTPFTVSAVIYNRKRGSITFRATHTPSLSGSAIYYASDGYAGDGDLQSTNFSNAFNGYVGVGAQMDEEVNRYYAIIDYFTYDTDNNNGNYILGFIVTGQPGQRIDCFSDGIFTCMSDYGEEGWRDGSCDGSISDMACGDNILVVGSYTSRANYGALDGKGYGYPTLTEGDISPFSSWGTIINGKQLPDICAPGAAVISSISGPYVDAYGVEDSIVSGYKAESGHTNYYMQCVGTSMACPVVAGSIALWLQADPTLTIEDVKDIISKTAVRDEYVTDAVQWGMGKFSAIEGLKEVLRRKGWTDINNVEGSNALLVRALDQDHVEIFLAGAQNLTITLFDMTGQVAATYAAAGDTFVIDAADLAAGVYIVRVNNRYQDKLIIR